MELNDRMQAAFERGERAYAESQEPLLDEATIQRLARDFWDRYHELRAEARAKRDDGEAH